jgi:hypothetical protein
MTEKKQPTRDETLRAIVRTCRANLALAKKRTQGKWKAHNHAVSSPSSDAHNAYLLLCGNRNTTTAKDHADAAFIAACAGAAEAGWETTILAIKAFCGEIEDFGELCRASDALDAIIRQWETESLIWEDDVEDLV